MRTGADIRRASRETFAPASPSHAACADPFPIDLSSLEPDGFC